MISHIDGVNRLIYLDASTVNASIHPVEIYKEIRALRKNDEELRKYSNFMVGAGNIPKGGGKFTERYFTLLEGARIVPYDISHVLSITGTIITDDGKEGVYCFNRMPLTAGVQVDIQYIPPQVEIVTVATGSAVTEQDKLDIASTVWNSTIRTLSEQVGLTQAQNDALMLTKYQNKAVYVDTEAAVNGDGSSTSPFDNVNDAKDFAEDNGIHIVYLYGDVVIPSNVKNFTVIGIGSPVVDCNGQDLKNTEFVGCELRGTYTDKIKASKCILGNNFELNGGFKDCSIVGNLTCIDGGSVTLFDCFGNIANDAESTLSLNGLGSSRVAVENFHGHLTLTDVNNAADRVDISMPSDHLIIDASCTAGSITLAGHIILTDNSGPGCTVNTEAVIVPATTADTIIASQL